MEDADADQDDEDDEEKDDEDDDAEGDEDEQNDEDADGDADGEEGSFPPRPAPRRPAKLYRIAASPAFALDHPSAQSHAATPTPRRRHGH